MYQAAHNFIHHGSSQGVVSALKSGPSKYTNHFWCICIPIVDVKCIPSSLSLCHFYYIYVYYIDGMVTRLYKHIRILREQALNIIMS